MSSEETCSKMVEDFDGLLQLVGSRGRYQRKVLFFVLVPVSFFVGFGICQLFFQVAIPKHWCYVPGREHTSYSSEEWMDITIPRNNETGKYSSCERYRTDVEFDSALSSLSTNNTEGCADGWEFDTRQFQATVATDNNWYCEQNGYSTNILTINLAGNAVGTFIIPMLADIVGRRIMFYVLLVIHLVFTAAYVFVTEYALHITFRFFRGFVEMGVYLMPHITVMELIHPDDRVKATTISWVGWMTGMCITSLVAWLVPNWKHLAAFSCIAPVLGFFYWRHLPESPRWLLSKGRMNECADILMQISLMNGKKDVSRNDVEERLAFLSKKQQEDKSILQAFRYPKLRIRTIMLFVMASCINMVYGITLIGISVLPDNQFLSHFILSLSELPSNGLGWAMTHYLGRRVTCYVAFFVTAAFCCGALFCTHDQWLMMGVVALIKLFVTIAFLVMDILSSEVFPTPIRSTGRGLVCMCGLVSTVAAPTILNSGHGPTFQYWVMLMLMLLGVLTSLAMPETIGLSLPQTFQEAEDIGSDRPIRTWVHHWNSQKYPGHKINSQNPMEVIKSKPESPDKKN